MWGAVGSQHTVPGDQRKIEACVKGNDQIVNQMYMF